MKRLITWGKSYIFGGLYILRKVLKRTLRRITRWCRTTWLWIRIPQIRKSFAENEVVLYKMDKYSIVRLRREISEGRIQWYADLAPLNGQHTETTNVPVDTLLRPEKTPSQEWIDPLAHMHKRSRRRLLTRTQKLRRKRKSSQT